MVDKKRLNAEGKHVITQGEKDAWQRGKLDAIKNLKLNGLNGVNVDKAIQIVKLYAETGDEQFIRQKVGLSISDIRKVLTGFKINSIEDAKAIVKKGLIADLDAAKSEDQQKAITERNVDEAAMSKNLKEHDKSFGPKAKRSDREQDELLRDRREEAFRKNKADKVRALIAEGIQPPSKNQFQIRVSDVAVFRSMIPHGVSSLQRRFGGSAKDIVSEIKRLSPATDIDMLRP